MEVDERRRWWEVVMIDGGGSRLDVVEVEVRLMIVWVWLLCKARPRGGGLTLDRRMQFDSTTRISTEKYDRSQRCNCNQS